MKKVAKPMVKKFIVTLKLQEDSNKTVKFMRDSIRFALDNNDPYHAFNITSIRIEVEDRRT